MYVKNEDINHTLIFSGRRQLSMVEQLQTQTHLPILQMQNVNKDISGYPLLRNINITVHSGELVYIIGENGTGKTTLLNLMSHEDVPDTGLIQVGNYLLSDLTKEDIPYFKRTIGYMHQNAGLIPNATVKENLIYPLNALGYDRKTVKQRYNDILTLTGLYDYRNKNVGSVAHPELSGGQLQLVALGQAIVNKPDVLFCDEPTGNLYSGKADYIMDVLEKIAKMNTAVVMVTHSPEYVKNRPHNTYEIVNKTLVQRRKVAY